MRGLLQAGPSSASASATEAGTGRRTVFRAGHGSSVAWCSVSKTMTVVSRGSARARRLNESVVLRVKMTSSSPARRRRWRPRRGLLHRGAADTRVPAPAAVHAAVGRGRALHGVRDGQECWGGGAVVEVRDIEPLTKDGGHALLGADDRQDGAGVTQVDDWCGGHVCCSRRCGPSGMSLESALADSGFADDQVVTRSTHRGEEGC